MALKYVVDILNKDGGVLGHGTFVAASDEEALQQAKEDVQKHANAWRGRGVSDFKISSRTPLAKKGARTCRTCGSKINYGAYCGKCEFHR